MLINHPLGKKVKRKVGLSRISSPRKEGLEHKFSLENISVELFRLTVGMLGIIRINCDF